MALDDAFLEELRFKNEIEPVISQYVTLKRAGALYKGLCPFHNEKTPSFTVYPNTQSFYCFGCGAGGDVITFIRRMENLDYIDAVKSLAERAGMQMPDDGYDNSLSIRRKRILEANRAAARFYHECLYRSEGRAGLAYYQRRGLKPGTIKHFGLGYAPDSWDSLTKHLRQKGFSVEELVAANLVRQGSRSHYDNFRNRVMTPIIDIRGNVIAFGGRVLDDSKPKYINTSDTMVYKKTHEVFAMNFAKDAAAAGLILCEGYMDVIALHQAGFTNAVAGCGTALTQDQVKLLSRYTKEVILAYDADEAGRKAVQKAIGLFARTDVNVKVPELKGGKDPDEIIQKLGAERFKGMLEGASNDVEFTLLDLRSRYDLKSTDGKRRFSAAALEYLATLSSSVEQDLYLRRLSEELGIGYDSLKLDFAARKEAIGKKRKSQYTKKITAQAAQPVSQEARRLHGAGLFSKSLRAQERLCSLLMFHPDFVKIETDFPMEAFDSPFYSKVFSVLVRRLQEDRGVDLTALSGEFSPEELGELARLQANYQPLTDPRGEYADCINTVKAEYNKRNQGNPADLTDEEFRRLFSRNV